MSKRVKTRAALMQAVKDFLTTNATISTAEGVVVGLPTILDANIAWRNKKFDPSGKDLWCSVFYTPNSPVGRTVGVGGMDEINGFVQIDFNIAPDVGEGVFLKWEEKAELFFHAGRFFTYEGHSVIVTSSGMTQSRFVDNNFRQSLTVAFKSHVKRPQLT